MLKELTAALARSRAISSEIEVIRDALQCRLVSADVALMYAIEQGLTGWLSPWCSDMFKAAERANERARWERQAGPQLTVVDALVLKESDKAIQVQNGGAPVWLNKNEVEIEREIERTDQVRVTLPIELAKQKGL